MVKEISSDTNIAALHTIAIAKNVSSDQVLRPREINQRFTQTIQKSIQQDLNEGSSDLFLHPHDLTKVLKQLEKMGIFLNVKTKNQIRELERGKRHAGKKTHEDDRDLGGKPSVYKLTEEFEKLNNVIEKPEAAEMLYDEILRSRLAHNLIRFILLAFWHAAKMDGTYFGKSVGFGAAFFQDIL
jgi:hypothetical protein